jgi:hypothetical protein
MNAQGPCRARASDTPHQMKTQTAAMTFMPASLLPFKKTWPAIANGLPKGSMLFIVPARDAPINLSIKRVTTALRKQGRVIVVIMLETPPASR